MPSGQKQLNYLGRAAEKALPGFSFTFSVDRLEAEAYLSIDRYPESFVEQPVIDALKKLLSETFSHGLDPEFLASGLADIIIHRKRVKGKVIAKGTLPVPGDPAIVDILVSRPSREYLVRPDGTLDFKTRDLFRCVSAKEILLVKTPPTKGHPGLSVFGTLIPPTPGADKRVIPGRNVESRTEGEREVLYATAEGQVSIETGFNSFTINVSPEMRIRGNVDYETGNISFKGSLIIYGSILSGFSVNVTGNLQVDGVIEPGTSVTVGGDLDVGKGILGCMEEPDPSRGVRVFGNLRALYAENASLTVQGDVYLRSALNCQIMANGEITVEKSLIGGETMSFRSIQVGVIGNSAGTKTLVSCGISHTIINRLNLIIKILADLQKQQESVTKNLKFVSTHPEKISGGKAGLLQEGLRQKLESLNDQIIKLEVKKADLALALLEESNSTITAMTFSPGTVLAIRNSRISIDTEQRSRTYYQKLPEEIIAYRPSQPGSKKPGNVSS
ncbi:MAG TPA: FapA family protein [Candidatus Ozemobacteraceae bacterium]